MLPVVSYATCIDYIILFCILTSASCLPFCSGERNLTKNRATMFCVWVMLPPYPGDSAFEHKTRNCGESDEDWGGRKSKLRMGDRSLARLSTCSRPQKMKADILGYQPPPLKNSKALFQQSERLVSQHNRSIDNRRAISGPSPSQVGIDQRIDGISNCSLA